MPEAESLRRTKRKTEGVLTESGCVPKKLAGLEGKDLKVRQTAAVWPLFIQPPVLIHDGGGLPLWLTVQSQLQFGLIRPYRQ